MNLFLIFYISIFSSAFAFTISRSRSIRLQRLHNNSPRSTDTEIVSTANIIKKSMMRPFSLALSSLTVALIGQNAFAAETASELEKITSKVFFDININNKSAGKSRLTTYACII